MRGRFTDQGGLFSYIAPDKRARVVLCQRTIRCGRSGNLSGMF
ncbi:hypothetical protein ACVWW7_000171 [Bradyrhizobium sp. LM6.9]